MAMLGSILLGIINIFIVVAILVFIGAIIVMLANWFQWPIDWNVQRIYLLIVALIALYMLVALLLGMPTLRIIPDTRAWLLLPRYAGLLLPRYA